MRGSRLSFVAAGLVAMVLVAGVGPTSRAESAAVGQVADDVARQFIADHETRVRPLERAVAIAWWNANISGKDEDFKAKEEAQNKLDAALADKTAFEKLKPLR